MRREGSSAGSCAARVARFCERAGSVAGVSRLLRLGWYFVIRIRRRRGSPPPHRRPEHPCQTPAGIHAGGSPPEVTETVLVGDLLEARAVRGGRGSRRAANTLCSRLGRSLALPLEPPPWMA